MTLARLLPLRTDSYINNVSSHERARSLELAGPVRPPQRGLTARNRPSAPPGAPPPHPAARIAAQQQEKGQAKGGLGTEAQPADTGPGGTGGQRATGTGPDLPTRRLRPQPGEGHWGVSRGSQSCHASGQRQTGLSQLSACLTAHTATLPGDTSWRIIPGTPVGRSSVATACTAPHRQIRQLVPPGLLALDLRHLSRCARPGKPTPEVHGSPQSPPPPLP